MEQSILRRYEKSYSVVVSDGEWTKQVAGSTTVSIFVTSGCGFAAG